MSVRYNVFQKRCCTCIFEFVISSVKKKVCSIFSKSKTKQLVFAFVRIYTDVPLKLNFRTTLTPKFTRARETNLPTPYYLKTYWNTVNYIFVEFLKFIFFEMMTSIEVMMKLSN